MYKLSGCLFILLDYEQKFKEDANAYFKAFLKFEWGIFYA